MFVWKKKYDNAIAHYRGLFEARGEIIDDRNMTIGRLQRTSEDMLARNLELQAKVDGRGMEISALKEQCAGILRDKIAESERANLAEQRINSLLAEIAALRPDAEKYRERCRRDREHAENARERKRALKAAA
ncbi:hypothetical protein [Sphingobium yanoikuyae]|uniref:Uncharacterized protein n=1 Tax=Sphingobium yanoikuyae TaxID=13690 RepID=A0A430BZC0_SPHYA|nr:hypothetical protein [Sphingobium yanoikuyae]RSU58049.1 hypothetical protein DAH51_07340 [Sphingobium yanoikuyae]